MMVPFTFFDGHGERHLMKVRRPERIELMSHELFELGFAFEVEVLMDGQVRIDCARPEDTQTISDERVANNEAAFNDGFDRMVMFAYVRATRPREEHIATSMGTPGRGIVL